MLFWFDSSVDLHPSTFLSFLSLSAQIELKMSEKVPWENPPMQTENMQILYRILYRNNFLL